MNIEQRLSRLERSNRLLLALLAVVAAAWLVAAKAPAAPERLTVRSLTLVDDKGKIRGNFVCEDGDASLGVWSAHDTPGVVISCDADSAAPTVSIRDKENKAVIWSAP